MTHQSGPFHHHASVDAGRQVAQLRQILQLVEQIAGRTEGTESHEAEFDQAARLSGAYADALPIVQRRFDAVSAEIASWASVGVSALVAASERGQSSHAAAASLALELRHGLDNLTGLLGR